MDINTEWCKGLDQEFDWPWTRRRLRQKDPALIKKNAQICLSDESCVQIGKMKSNLLAHQNFDTMFYQFVAPFCLSDRLRTTPKQNLHRPGDIPSIGLGSIMEKSTEMTPRIIHPRPEPTADKNTVLCYRVELLDAAIVPTLIRERHGNLFDVDIAKLWRGKVKSLASRCMSPSVGHIVSFSLMLSASTSGVNTITQLFGAFLRKRALPLEH